MKLIKKDKKGFTLVELIVVIAILAILALILIPAITGYIKKADRSSLESSARSLYSQAAVYMAETDSDEANLADELKPGDKYGIKYVNDKDDIAGAYFINVFYTGKDDPEKDDIVTFDENGVMSDNFDR